MSQLWLGEDGKHVRLTDRPEVQEMLGKRWWSEEADIAFADFVDKHHDLNTMEFLEFCVDLFELGKYD